MVWSSFLKLQNHFSTPQKREKATISLQLPSPHEADGSAAEGIAGKLQTVTFPPSIFEHLSLEQWKGEQGRLPLR